LHNWLNWRVFVLNIDYINGRILTYIFKQVTSVVARLVVPVADSCHCTKVRGELVTMEGCIGDRTNLFFSKKIKLTLKFFEFSYQNVEKYQKKLS
jgi:hypothetical protein